jgi:hypothetical protein
VEAHDRYHDRLAGEQDARSDDQKPLTSIKLARSPKAVFTCPMAKADWLQTDPKQVSNPYMGKKMPTCGEMKKS